MTKLNVLVGSSGQWPGASRNSSRVDYRCGITYATTTFPTVRIASNSSHSSPPSPSSLNHSSSSSSFAVGLSLQSIIMIFPMNSLSFLDTSLSVVLWNGVVCDCGISCIRYRIAVTVSEVAISSYLAGNGPKYRNCRLRTSNPYSSWPYGTVRGRKRLKLPP